MGVELGRSQRGQNIEYDAEEDIWAQVRRTRGYWRKMHSDELQGLYCSLDIIRVTKSSNIIWAGHVARIGKMRM
jgi:hypothetical protein